MEVKVLQVLIINSEHSRLVSVKSTHAEQTHLMSNSQRTEYAGKSMTIQSNQRQLNQDQWNSVGPCWCDGTGGAQVNEQHHYKHLAHKPATAALKHLKNTDCHQILTNLH